MATNSKFYIVNNYKRSLIGKELNDYKRSLHLSKIQREVIIGLLLGDGHLESQNNKITYRLKVGQTLKHKIYVYHLFDIFKNFCGTGPREYINPNTNYISVTFNTYSHISFKFYGKQFYNKNNLKVVPKLIHKWLTPRGLAYWFMDDGSRKSKTSKGIYLNTQSFTYREVKVLSDLLQNKFNLITKIKLDKNLTTEKLKPNEIRRGYRIYISGYSYDIFKKYIEKYITEDMKYKLP